MLFRREQDKRERYERAVEPIFGNLYGTALRLTRDPEEASDLVQEAIIRGFEAYDRFDGRNFRAWMLRIMTNLYINHYRKRQREGSTASWDDEHVEEPIAEPANLPDRQLLDEMVGEEVEAALGELNPLFREAVVLSDIEGLPYEEIAEMLEVPVGTVRSRIARGRAQLRGRLERFARDHGYIKENF